jgi:hypothetical protein
VRTAPWAYTGKGRIALCRAPQGTPRGYRIIAPPRFFIGDTRRAPADIWATFALADACAMWRALHALVYPWEPVLVSTAPAGVESYRTLLAEWLSVHTGEAVTELENPETHEAIKIRRPNLHGLRPAIWPAEPAAETAPEQV